MLYFCDNANLPSLQACIVLVPVMAICRSIYHVRSLPWKPSSFKISTTYKWKDVSSSYIRSENYFWLINTSYWCQLCHPVSYIIATSIMVLGTCFGPKMVFMPMALLVDYDNPRPDSHSSNELMASENDRVGNPLKNLAHQDPQELYMIGCFCSLILCYRPKEAIERYAMVLKINMSTRRRHFSIFKFLLILPELVYHHIHG